MNSSMHYGTDTYGYKYANTICTYDEEFDVLECKPALLFDIKSHGLKIKKTEYYDYKLTYEIKDNVLYLRHLSFEPAILYKPAEIMGAKPERPYPNKKLNLYTFDSLPVDYSGVWTIGKDFDFRFWSKDDRLHTVPYCPEVYKKNGYVRFENGRIVEFELHPRNN